MRGLFIIGNKRSGSTHIMRLLNLHDKIYVSNESDIVWILFNYHQGREMTDYPHDSPSGMHESLRIAQETLRPDSSVEENFERYQTHLMETGFLKMPATHKKDLAYIGDQKPYQNIDPELLPFVMENFKRPKFIHILRHPFEVVDSSMKFMGGKGIWEKMSAEEIMQKWELHESWVAQAKRQHNIDVLQVNYTSLIFNTQKVMKEVFTFLELPFTEKLLEDCRIATLPNMKKIVSYPLTESQKDLMKTYGMKTSFSVWEANILPSLQNYYYRALLKFKRTSS
jgi:hypothetical protein